MSGLSLDELLAQAREVQEQIDSLADDDFVGLQELRARRRVLEGWARELYLASRTPEQIKKELDDANAAVASRFEPRAGSGIYAAASPD